MMASPRLPIFPGLNRLLRAQDGAAMIEFTILMPVLVLLMVGISEFGRALWYHQLVNKGIRDGTRYLTRVPLTETFIDQAKNMAMTGAPAGGSFLLSYWTDPNSIQVTTANGPAGFYRTDPVIITMTANVTINFDMLNAIGLDPNITLTVADQARHIGE